MYVHDNVREGGTGTDEPTTSTRTCAMTHTSDNRYSVFTRHNTGSSTSAWSSHPCRQEEDEPDAPDGSFSSASITLMCGKCTFSSSCFSAHSTLRRSPGRRGIVS